MSRYAISFSSEPSNEMILTARKCEMYPPSEDAIQRALSIHEPAGVDFTPICISQITGIRPYHPVRHFQKE